jgi:hypothetical protein
MAVQWGLAQPQGGGFDYLESLQAIGQQQLQQQAIQQRQYGFERQQQQDQARIGIGTRVRNGDFTGARQEAALGGDFDFANAIGGLDEDRIKRLSVELDAIGTLAPQLKTVPLEQRAQVGAAALARAGFSPEELAQMDWSDAGLDASYAMSASGKAALAARVKAAEPYTLSPGAKRYSGDQVIADNPAAEKPIWDAEGGNLIYPSRYGGGAEAQPAPAAGGPLTFAGLPGERVTSGYRTPAHNAKVGGVANSYHTRLGADGSPMARDSVPPAGMSMAAYAAALRQQNPSLDVINEGDHVHMEPRGSVRATRPASAPGVVNVRAPRPRGGGNAPSGYRYNGDRLEPIPGGPADPSGPTNRNVQSNRKAEADFRKEFEQDKGYTEFQAARTSFNQLRDLVRKKGKHTGADDLAIIFNFMRSLDPASVVREGEFKQAANSSGLIEGLGNRFQRAQDGQWLNPKQRQEMLRTAYSNYGSRRDAYNNRAEQFRGYARDNGINPDRVARTYTPDKPAASASPSRLTVGQSANIGGIKITRTR